MIAQRKSWLINQRIGFQEVKMETPKLILMFYSFQNSSSVRNQPECPAWSAVALILNFTDYTFFPPVFLHTRTKGKQIHTKLLRMQFTYFTNKYEQGRLVTV